jgi:hypothetical protein
MARGMTLCTLSGMKRSYTSEGADRAIASAKKKGIRLYKYICREWRNIHYHLTKNKPR